MTLNPILNTDGYKPSHWRQYPPGTDGLYEYISSRGGAYDKVLFFGLQAFLLEYMTKRVTVEDITEARSILTPYGAPFNEEGWEYIVREHGGKLPVRIRAVPEGTAVPMGVPIVTVESTDPKVFWLPSYLETALLRAVWYPTTVATTSWMVRSYIRMYLEKTSDDVEGQLPWKLHDFGARGVSSEESAALGGLGHLVSFQGTDTISAIVAARKWYHATNPAGTIPAAEHSTITSWGRDREVDAYRNMIAQYGKPGAVFTVVSDSYDIHKAVREHWGQTLKQEVLDSGATLVIRPDSGDPVTIVLNCLEALAETFGYTQNSKMYKVLNGVRIIQGDGIDANEVLRILSRMESRNFSADNIAFGMGGGLLQKCDRDSQKFAMKCSAARIHGEWVDVYKDPVTDPGKASVRGRVGAYLTHKGIVCMRESEAEAIAEATGYGPTRLDEVVYEDGCVRRLQSLDSIRELAKTY